MKSIKDLSYSERVLLLNELIVENDLLVLSEDQFVRLPLLGYGFRIPVSFRIKREAYRLAKQERELDFVRKFLYGKELNYSIPKDDLESRKNVIKRLGLD